MNVPFQSRILAAMLYADIFHYPLTIRELTQWIPSDTSMTYRTVYRHIKDLVKKQRIGYTIPFLYLSGHKIIIQNRIHRLATSIYKWQKIRRVAKILHYIPTITMVGVTGGLAVNNADHNDDIDICIIARHNTLWVTRCIATLMVEIFSKRRHPMDVNVGNTVCLNMFLTEKSLHIPKKEQGWYTAHEVLQMVPLWDRSGMYAKYLWVNRWVKNWFAQRYLFQQHIQVPSMKTSKNNIKLYQILEKPLKHMQLWYMRKRRTTEIVQDSIIRFHPNDARIWIRKSFLAKLQRFKVPLDKKYNQI